ncbi:hypothetical protein ACS3SW_05330 [Roseobacteraceae bacterium S113]
MGYIFKFRTYYDPASLLSNRRPTGMRAQISVRDMDGNAARDTALQVARNLAPNSKIGLLAARAADARDFLGSARVCVIKKRHFGIPSFRSEPF